VSAASVAVAVAVAEGTEGTVVVISILNRVVDRQQAVVQPFSWFVYDNNNNNNDYDSTRQKLSSSHSPYSTTITSDQKQKKEYSCVHISILNRVVDRQQAVVQPFFLFVDKNYTMITTRQGKICCPIILLV